MSTRRGNIIKDYLYQLVSMIGILFTPQTADPESGNDKPRVWYKSTDKTFRFVDDAANTATITPANGDVVTVGGAQTITGAKTFADTKLLLRNAADSFSTTLKAAAATAARTVTLPDHDGTVAVVTTAPTTAGQVVRASAAGVHTASTATYPDTVAQGDIVVATAANVLGSLPDVAVGQVLASGGVGAAPAYTANPTVASLTTTGDVRVGGNLVVAGATVSASSEHIKIGDNYLDQNDGYVTAAAQPGGLTVRYLPTATADTVAAGGFTAGVPATSNPTIATTGAATFALADIVAIDGAADADNNGLFEVLAHAANVLTVRGVGLTACVEDWTSNQLVTDETVQGTITKVGVSILRAGADGKWEQATGNTTPFTFADVAAAGAATGASGTGAVTGATAAETATMVAEARSGHIYMQAPAAADAAAGTCAIVTDVVVVGGAQVLAAQPDRPRKLILFITDANSSISAGTLDLVGVGPSGEAVTESIDLTGGTASKTSTKAYATLTSATVANLAGNEGGDKIALGVATALGLVGCKTPASSTFAVHRALVDGAGEAVGTVDAAAGTIVPNTVPNAAHNYEFYYTFAATPTQNSHSHNAGTLAGPSHTHPQNS